MKNDCNKIDLTVTEGPQCHFLQLYRQEEIVDTKAPLKRAKNINLILDKNILDEISNLIGDGEAMHDSERRKEFEARHRLLLPFVNTINTNPFCSIIPGFAIEEVKWNIRDKHLKDFDTFLKYFCPGVHDAIDMKAPFVYRIDDHYKEMTPGRQYLHSLTILAVLKVYELNYTRKDASPFQKFSEFLNFFDRTINLLPILETMAALYAFSSSEEKRVSGAYQAFRNRIKSNIFKKDKNKNRNIQNVLSHVYNISNDMVYYKLVTMAKTKLNLDLNKETYFVTMDNGLEMFSRIHYYQRESITSPMFESPGLMILVPEEEKESEYMTSCREYFIYTQKKRLQDGSCSHERDLLQTVKFQIEETKSKLSDYFEKAS